MPAFNPTVWASIVTAGGAVVVIIIDRWLRGHAEKNAESLSMRQELRLTIGDLRVEITTLRGEVVAIEKEREELRTKYWELMRQYNKLYVELLTALAKLNDRLDEDAGVPGFSKPFDEGVNTTRRGEDVGGQTPDGPDRRTEIEP